MRQKIISIHTPMAGGTTMLNLWKQAFGEEGVLLDYGDPPANPSADFIIDPIGWADQRPTVLPEQVKVVHGHFRPGKYHLIKDAYRLTMLRHPVDNLISIYCYWKKIPPQPNAVHQYFLANKLDVVGLAKLPIMQYLYSDTYFGGWDMRRLDFIGRHENRTEDLKRLSHTLGITMDIDLHLNATEPGGVDSLRMEIMSDAKIMRSISDLLLQDINFYEKHSMA